MAAALFLANVGVLPHASAAYTAVNRYAVPLAVPMLLYDSDIRRVVSDTGSLLAAFAVGAAATVVGTLLAFVVLSPMMISSLGGDGSGGVAWKVAAALCARHIGGAINFVAVAETLRVPADAVSAAIAADNVIVALYFLFLFALAKQGGEEEGNKQGDYSSPPAMNTTTTSTAVSTSGELEYSITTEDDDEETTNSITLPSLAVSISVACALVTAGGWLTRAILPAGTSALPLTSALTVLAATARPKFFREIRSAGNALGILFIQMFFAASGAAGSIRLVLQKAPALFLFSAVQILIHFGFLIAIGRGCLKLPARELYLASNANVGGPTTAAAMAQAKQWKRLVLPALLVGILGYATATAIALALGPVLVRLLPTTTPPLFGGS